MTANKDLKHSVVELKTRLGITQSQLADRLGVNASYLSSVINGRFPLTDNLTTRLKLLEENCYKSPSKSRGAGANANDAVLSVQDTSALLTKLMGMIDNLQTQVNEDRKLLNILVDKILTQNK
ncbi:MAG: helix-turn-helix transcriptional regulator [Bacteroidales bacterium]|jgi:transcriptional regulator with XRE-family HTH domain|nr:helix-turn-helix transcriptional regulator [Bacteroidales bacterium]